MRTSRNTKLTLWEKRGSAADRRVHVLVEVSEEVADRAVVRHNVHGAAASRARPAKARRPRALPYELREVADLSLHVRRLALGSPSEAVVRDLLVPAGGRIYACIPERVYRLHKY